MVARTVRSARHLGLVIVALVGACSFARRYEFEPARYHGEALDDPLTRAVEAQERALEVCDAITRVLASEDREAFLRGNLSPPSALDDPRQIRIWAQLSGIPDGELRGAFRRATLVELGPVVSCPALKSGYTCTGTVACRSSYLDSSCAGPNPFLHPKERFPPRISCPTGFVRPFSPRPPGLPSSTASASSSRIWPPGSEGSCTR